jgi:hypothetical protein
MNPCFQVAGHSIHAEFSRIKILFQPLGTILVIRVFGIGNRSQQGIIPINAATILRKTGILARSADGISHARIRRKDLLDEDFVQPTVTEIIFLEELSLRYRGESD